MFSGSQAALAGGHGEAARRARGEGVPQSVIPYFPPRDLCSLPTPTRLRVGAFRPSLSLSTRALNAQRACRARAEGRARRRRTEREAGALRTVRCPRPPLGTREQARLSSLAKGRREGGATFSYKYILYGLFIFY